VFRQFALLCRQLDLYDRELLAVDRTRIRQSTTRTATSPAIRWRELIPDADEWLNDYLERLDRSNAAEDATDGGARTKNFEKIAALRERCGRYEWMSARLDHGRAYRSTSATMFRSRPRPTEG
jgi:hypothetical protein